MKSRLQTSNLTVSPWQLPPLDDPNPSSVEQPPIEAVELDIATDDIPDDVTVPDSSVEIDERTDVPPPAATEEAAAEAYADGFRKGVDDGTAQGYAAGLEAGKQAAEQMVAAQARNLASIAAQLAAPIAALDRQVEEAVVALALEVARHVIGGEVSRSRDYLVRLIREAIAKVPIEMGTPSVLLNPEDLSTITALAPDIEEAGIALVADETIEPGGCIVIANGDDLPIKDRRWHPRASEGVSQVNLTLASRWRSVMLALFDGEEL